MYKVIAAVLIAILLLGLAWTFGRRPAVAPVPGTLTVTSGPEVHSTTTVASTTTTIIFPPKPVSATHGTVAGTVTLGPTCPVEQNPPEARCAPKPYSTVITITSASGAVSETHSDGSGVFTVSLMPGTYTFAPHGGQVLPRCASAEVRVVAGTTSTAALTCDTGIR